MAKAEMNTSNAGGGMMVQPNRSCPRNVECRKPRPVVCPGRQMMATNTASTNNKQKLNAIEGSTSPRSRRPAGNARDIRVRLFQRSKGRKSFLERSDDYLRHGERRVSASAGSRR